MDYPALNIIGGRRYMKKRSSLKTNILELFPCDVNRIIVPLSNPCNQNIKSQKNTIKRTFETATSQKIEKEETQAARVIDNN